MSFIRKLDNSPLSSFFSTEDQTAPFAEERLEPNLKRKREDTPETYAHLSKDAHIHDLFDRILSGEPDLFEHPTDDLNLEDFLILEETPDLPEVETILETVPQISSTQSNPTELPAFPQDDTEAPLPLVPHKDENSFNIENERHLISQHQIFSKFETTPSNKYKKTPSQSVPPQIEQPIAKFLNTLLIIRKNFKRPCLN